MRPDDLEVLRVRLMELLERGEDPLVESTWQNPVAVYDDDEHLERERTLLFADHPLVIGRGDEIAAPHDFITHDHSGNSLILIRGGDGVARAFLNVCRHRGVKVEFDKSGNKRRFACPFHAWTYDTDGTLVSIPNAEGFNDIDPADHGLVPVACAEHLGFLWVHLTADPTQPLDIETYLGPLGTELGGYGIEGHHSDIYEVLEEPFNWKFVLDGFFESYHFRFLHRDSIAPYIRSNFALVDDYGSHFRMVVLRETIDDYLAAGDPTAPLLPHLAIVYLMFPNTIVLWQRDHFEYWTAWPGADGAASSTSEARLLAPEPVETDKDRAIWDTNWKILMDTVLNEDFAMSRSIQTNVATNAQTHAIFGRQEGALQHFHRTLNAITLPS